MCGCRLEIKLFQHYFCVAIFTMFKDQDSLYDIDLAVNISNLVLFGSDKYNKEKIQIGKIEEYVLNVLSRFFLYLFNNA